MNASFERDLLGWFGRRKRDLPWRDCGDPYAIWVSEIMLQQTQVATVIPYFHAFLRRFPTIATLAQSSQADVLKMWQGLGYYSRARHLHAAARLVMTRHCGQLPPEHDALRRLPGLGDYAAGAIASIAFGLPFAAVDGNVLRVFSRLTLLEEDIAQARTKRVVREAITTRLNEPGGPAAQAPGDFNQALMELGATVCTPTAPDCARCPAQRHCRGWAADRVAELPIKTKKSPPVPVHWAVVRLSHKNELLIVQQEATGIWGGLWTFPMVALEAGLSDAAMRERVQTAMAELGLTIRLAGPLGLTRHTLTHRLMHLHRFEAAVAEAVPVALPYRWCALDALATFAWPRPFLSWVNGVSGDGRDCD
jgi:A/G-specific adenine glycosylase